MAPLPVVPVVLALAAGAGSAEIANADFLAWFARGGGTLARGVGLAHDGRILPGSRLAAGTLLHLGNEPTLDSLPTNCVGRSSIHSTAARSWNSGTVLVSLKRT